MNRSEKIEYLMKVASGKLKPVPVTFLEYTRQGESYVDEHGGLLSEQEKNNQVRAASEVFEIVWEEIKVYD